MNLCGKYLDYCVPRPSLGKLSKSERLSYIINRIDSDFSLQDIQNRAPDISQVLIKQFIYNLVKEGKLLKNGNTKGTTYTLREENRIVFPSKRY